MKPSHILSIFICNFLWNEFSNSVVIFFSRRHCSLAIAFTFDSFNSLVIWLRVCVYFFCFLSLCVPFLHYFYYYLFNTLPTLQSIVIMSNCQQNDISFIFLSNEYDTRALIIFFSFILNIVGRKKTWREREHSKHWWSRPFDMIE